MAKKKGKRLYTNEQAGLKAMEIVADELARVEPEEWAKILTDVPAEPPVDFVLEVGKPKDILPKKEDLSWMKDMIQPINISTEFNRESLNELGHIAPYTRYVNFPPVLPDNIAIDDVIPGTGGCTVLLANGQTIVYGSASLTPEYQVPPRVLEFLDKKRERLVQKTLLPDEVPGTIHDSGDYIPLYPGAGSGWIHDVLPSWCPTPPTQEERNELLVKNDQLAEEWLQGVPSTEDVTMVGSNREWKDGIVPAEFHIGHNTGALPDVEVKLADIIKDYPSSIDYTVDPDNNVPESLTLEGGDKVWHAGDEFPNTTQPPERFLGESLYKPSEESIRLGYGISDEDWDKAKRVNLPPPASIVAPPTSAPPDPYKRRPNPASKLDFARPSTNGRQPCTVEARPGRGVKNV